MRFVLSSLLVAGISTSVAASEMTFRFNLPSFGGSGLSSSYYLALLESQKQPQESQTEDSTLEQFTNDLERRLLSSLANEITDQIFGENSASSGNFSIGGLNATFDTVGGNVVVTISDGISTTQITVPSI